jgi:hypothetical protein
MPVPAARQAPDRPADWAGHRPVLEKRAGHAIADANARHAGAHRLDLARAIGQGNRVAIDRSARKSQRDDLVAIVQRTGLTRMSTSPGPGAGFSPRRASARQAKKIPSRSPTAASLFLSAKQSRRSGWRN